jgi:hypothetical protein
MDFLVERPPKEILDQAEAYMSRRRFHVQLSERTETTALFTRIHTEKRLLEDAAKYFRRCSHP